MNWAWGTSLDEVGHSPGFPMWLTLAVAGFFGIIVLFTLLRADKSVANGALAVMSLLAIGIAWTATTRGPAPAAGADAAAQLQPQSPVQVTAALPALSCVDDIAGETVLAACEKTLFGSAESAAAAVSYAASRLTRLTALGDVAAANRNMTPELEALRHSIERDRYGLAAYVLLARDHCTPSDCAAFRALTDHSRIVANMDERVYDGLITRYAASWNAPAPVVGAVAALPSSMPTGRPTNAEFPSAASTPAVSIMNPEPGPGQATHAAAAANAPRPPTPPRPAAAPGAPSTLAAAAKKPPPKPRPPVQVAPAVAAPATTPAPAVAPAPAASND